MLIKLVLVRKEVVDVYLYVFGKEKYEVNFKCYVICMKYWLVGSRKDIEDLLMIKFIMLENFCNFNKCGVEYWNCVVVFCMNLWRKNGKLIYYCFSEVVNCLEKCCVYSKILKNKGVDVKRDFICFVYWINGIRMDINDFLDLLCSNSYLKKIIIKKIILSGKIELVKCVLIKQLNLKVKRRRLVYKKDDNFFECELLREEIEDLKEKLKVKIE